MSALFLIQLITFLIIINPLIASKPNFFFILVDDLGFGDVNFNRDTKDEEIITPNMDLLVKNEGLHLMRHYVHFTCTPTRSSFQSIYIYIYIYIIIKT